MIDVYPVRFSKAALEAASPEERLFHLMAGQSANDLNILGKLLIVSSSPHSGSEAEQAANAVTGLYLMRQMTSRLWESWKTFETYYPKIYSLYQGQWGGECESAWADMRRYFNAKCLVAQVRSKVGFHSDAAVVQRGYELLSDDDELVDYMTRIAGNSLYSSSNGVLTLAMVSLTGVADRQQALSKIYDEMVQAHSWINTLTLKYFSLFMMRYVIDEEDRERFLAAKVELEAPLMDQLTIPFFIDYERSFTEA